MASSGACPPPVCSSAWCLFLFPAEWPTSLHLFCGGPGLQDVEVEAARLGKGSLGTAQPHLCHIRGSHRLRQDSGPGERRLHLLTGELQSHTMEEHVGWAVLIAPSLGNETSHCWDLSLGGSRTCLRDHHTVLCPCWFIFTLEIVKV